MLRVQVVLLMACCATSNAQKLMDMFDKNQDGKVTKKEFMDVSRMVSSLAKSKDSEGLVEKDADQQLWDFADQNRDGWVDEAELEQWFRAMNAKHGGQAPEDNGKLPSHDDL